MVTLLFNMVDDDTDGCHKLFPTRLQHPFTLLHILQHMTQALIVQCIHLCFIILMSQNNSAPYSVGHIPEHLWGDTIKSMSHCLFKVSSGLVALLWNSLLYIFAGVTRHFGHPVGGLCCLFGRQCSTSHLERTYNAVASFTWESS
jgi:hypothetical protein